MSGCSTQIMVSKYDFPLKEQRVQGKISNLGLEQDVFQMSPEKNCHKRTTICHQKQIESCEKDTGTV